MSYQFIGFGFGLPLIIMPDQLGRKMSMTISLLFSVLAVTITFYAPFEYKKFGYFIFGVFHMKITLAFTHMFELIDNQNKAMCQTTVATFDAFSMGVTSLFFLYVSPSLDLLLNIYYGLGVVAIVLYIVVVPESPRWLLLKDPRSQRGKDILNYIAKFNGSKKRVPDYAVMDNLEQILNDKE